MNYRKVLSISYCYSVPAVQKRILGSGWSTPSLTGTFYCYQYWYITFLLVCPIIQLYKPAFCHALLNEYWLILIDWLIAFGLMQALTAHNWCAMHLTCTTKLKQQSTTLILITYNLYYNKLNTTCEVHCLSFHTWLFPRFPVLHFLTMHFWLSRIYQSHVFSPPYGLRKPTNTLKSVSSFSQFFSVEFNKSISCQSQIQQMFIRAFARQIYLHSFLMAVWCKTLPGVLISTELKLNTDIGAIFCYAAKLLPPDVRY